MTKGTAALRLRAVALATCLRMLFIAEGWVPTPPSPLWLMQRDDNGEGDAPMALGQILSVSSLVCNLPHFSQ
jgi:hypothetical protein